ncbi:MAG: acetyl-CoA carboxylase biotin carboxyl carrier protein subunit [Lawsonibacter sp.]|nr:acetyl-CoA carboxylase biotin carboxyl carrier protein subunit [Lawsonibacter sp.]
MDLQELYSLMDRFAASGLTGLEWKKKDEQVILRREPAAAPAVCAPSPVPAAPPAPAGEAQPAQKEGDVVTAPLVGVFYAAPAPEEPPFAPSGARRKKGEPLCLIEAMKMMSEVPAPADCVVEEVLAQNGEAVGYGAPLFRIRRV